MDGMQFDRLTRALDRPTARAGRRQVLAGMMFAAGQLLGESGPVTEARPHNRKQRRRRKRQRAATWVSPGQPNSTNCEDYMRALKCVWEEGGGPRWNCPTDIRAGGWRMSVCNGKSGITSLRGADLPSSYFVGADLSGVTFD